MVFQTYIDNNRNGAMFIQRLECLNWTKYLLHLLNLSLAMEVDILKKFDVISDKV